MSQFTVNNIGVAETRILGSHFPRLRACAVTFINFLKLKIIIYDEWCYRTKNGLGYGIVKTVFMYSTGPQFTIVLKVAESKNR